MDEAGIAQLAKGIRRRGLTDLPLVRKLDDGGLAQMVSGHRRKAAYALLAAEEDENTLRFPAVSSATSPTSSRSCCCMPPTTSCAASPYRSVQRRAARSAWRSSA